MKLMMFSVLLLLCSVTAIFAQDLPNNLTPAEKELLKTYIPPPGTDDTNPPPMPVRTIAEWEQLEAVAITWTSYTSILRQIVDYAQDECLVYIICNDSNTVKNYLTSGGVPLINLRFIYAPFNSVWIRDYGPWSVYSGIADSTKFIDWIYNRPRPLDDLIPGYIANYMNVPLHQTTAAPNDLTATGGNFMTDGHGTGFSSDLILTENSGKTEAQIDTIMKRYMGISKYIKMDVLPYDGIHHIDMHMKMLDEETILAGQYPSGISDGPQIELNLQYLTNNFLSCYGRPFKIVRIPMPPDGNGLYPSQGGQYRTFTNSLFVNKTIIVPVYDPQYDTTALRIYRDALPGYRVVGINSNSIIGALGAIHCIVKEIGSLEPVYISHAPVPPTIPSDAVEIKAYIKSRSGIAHANLYWSSDTSAGYNSVQMFLAAQDTFSAFITAHPAGTKIYYFITAASNSGKLNSKPITAPAGCYTFRFTNPVPVKLTYFAGCIEKHSIILKWKTSTETNNRGFYLQEKTGVPGWINKGFINGKGTTTEENNYSFEISSPGEGLHTYRLIQEDYNGATTISGEVNIAVQPVQFALFQNYPNPFNPSTTIRYDVPSSGEKEDSHIRLTIYDVLGNRIKTLADEQKPAGSYKIEWNAGSLPSGIYLYQLMGDNFSESKRMVLIK